MLSHRHVSLSSVYFRIIPVVSVRAKKAHHVSNFYMRLLQSYIVTKNGTPTRRTNNPNPVFPTPLNSPSSADNTALHANLGSTSFDGSTKSTNNSRVSTPTNVKAYAATAADNTSAIPIAVAIPSLTTVSQSPIAMATATTTGESQVRFLLLLCC